MSNKKKIYYRFTFSLASALSVGSGENQYSDSDIVRDSAGDPFIPGSSLAGIYRSMFENKEAEKYFGTALKEDKEAGSRILVIKRLSVTVWGWMNGRQERWDVSLILK